MERNPRKYESLERFADEFLAIGQGDLLGGWSEFLVNMSVWSELLMIWERNPRKYECLDSFADEFLAIGQCVLLGFLERIPRKYQCLERFAYDLGARSS